ncbi:unnamed protein product [Phytophthora fragariaefolia]|uniref:Unnamed protein product n=1 Tax=Phytophthora fragariaefolia TaxID=1490495 RepID=A0A9W6X2Z9_9STRA|nr:unnamed protein product [Phytophthora fragariaefolia]
MTNEPVGWPSVRKLLIATSSTKPGFKASGTSSSGTGTSSSGGGSSGASDGRMRVKKLSVNRRHKAGDEEAAAGVAAGGDSEQRRWVSPTKPLRPGAASGSSSGASSPTDVQQQQQHLGEHSPLQFQATSSTELFAQRGAAQGAAAMANATAADVAMHGDETDKNPLRRAMVDKIVETLRALKPHAPEKVLVALPKLAQHMEKALYKLAKNEAEYCDPSTLRLRIASIQENNAKRLLAQQQTPEQSSNAVPPLKPLAEEQARLIFQHLQSWRQKLVNMYGVAPWDILPNPTLAKVALYMPSSEQELTACGVGNEQVARFGSSLVQELQHLRGSAPQSKPANRPIKAKQPRKPSPGKRGSSEPVAAPTKKRKNGEAARLAPAAPSFNGTSLMAPAPLLPAVDSLPTLLPTVSMMPGGVTGSASATSGAMAMKQPQFTSTAVRLSPAQLPQQPFFSRLQPQQQQQSQPQQQQQQQQQQQGSASPGQESHMHLLAQGAGQLSKQQSGRSTESYEQELQSLRWMLHQSEEERSRLETERGRASLPPPAAAAADDDEAAVQSPAATSAPPLSLVDVRDMAVHLCGALAFLHGQGLVHADVKPENVVRAGAEAPLGSPTCLSPCSSPVKLVDFGNCLDASELAAYADDEASGGFEVQTVTYRAPEVAAGLLLCPAMDMWSLGCLLLECVTGKPLFTLPAQEAAAHERGDVTRIENDDLLQQIECVVTNGISLDAACTQYKSATRYENTTAKRKNNKKQEPSASLQARLEAVAPGNHQFHDFIYNLLDVNPVTRVTAKQALFHPFLQAFFPFGTVFARPSVHEVSRDSESAANTVRSATTSGAKRKAHRFEADATQKHSSRARKKKTAEKAASARSKDLRQVLKIIPRDVPGRSSLSPS